MPISEPTQPRSRATMQRFIDAGLRLVEESRWEDIPIASLVREANSSVGAFYARFGDKATLLAELDGVYAREMLALIGNFVTSPPADLGSDSFRLINELAGYHRRRRGLIRALEVVSRTAQDSSFAAVREELVQLFPTLARRLALCRDVPVAWPMRYLEVALTFTYSALREQIVFRENVPAVVEDADHLPQTLAAAFSGTVYALAVTSE